MMIDTRKNIVTLTDSLASS